MITYSQQKLTIMRKLFLLLPLLLLALFSFAQQKMITGTITNKLTNELLQGVTIQNKNKVVVTDVNGKFSISAKTGDVINISFVGMNPVKLKVINSSGDFNVALEAANQELNQVVITGYTSERKKDLTGAVSIVNMTDIDKQTTANPIKALQGEVAGVYITGDGTPSGSNASIQIRGVGTLNSTQPLYVIDGVPTEAGMHELNSQDIESMQILKDASAASIYGSRAANGVIIITTKKGKAGKLTINFSGMTSVSDYAYRMKVLNAGGYGWALWQASVNSGVDPNTNNLFYQYKWNLGANGQPQLNNIILPQYLDAAKTEKTSNTDWFSAITHPGILQDYNLTISNGNEKGSYLFSAGDYNNQGIVNTTYFTRYSMRLNSDYHLLNNRVTIGENFTLNKTREVGLPDPNIMQIALQAVPIVPIYTVDGGWGGPEGGMNDRQNPVRLEQDNKNNYYNYIRIFGNAYMDVKILNGLTFRTSYGVDYGNYNASNFQQTYQSGYLSSNINTLSVSESQTTKQNWSNTLNYVKNFRKHHLDVLAGTEYYHEYDVNFWASRTGFTSQDPSYTYLSAGSGTLQNGGGASEMALLSYFGKINYSYDNRYLASFTLRDDGSSVFGQNNRYGIFPAFSFLPVIIQKENRQEELIFRMKVLPIAWMKERPGQNMRIIR